MSELYPPIVMLGTNVLYSEKRYRITLSDWYKFQIDDVWIYYALKAEDGQIPWTKVIIRVYPTGVQFKVEDLKGHVLDDRFQSDYVYISEPDYQKLCAHLNGVK